MLKIKKCVVCGNMFPVLTNRTHKYCSEECKKEANRINNLENARKKREIKKNNKVVKYETIKEIVDSGHGHDYGQYVAQQYLKEHPLIVRKGANA